MPFPIDPTGGEPFNTNNSTFIFKNGGWALASIVGGPATRGTLTTDSFVIDNVSLPLALSNSPGSWTALYINGLRQFPNCYYIDGGNLLVISSGAVTIGDLIVFDYIIG